MVILFSRCWMVSSQIEGQDILSIISPLSIITPRLPHFLQSIMKENQEFANISDEEEDEIYIVQSTQASKPEPKRKKEESVFVKNDMMDHVQISIIGYDKETFLKIQTQTYKIQVKNLRTDEMWIIKRRYSDVAWLHEALVVNHLGYISPFFPSNTLGSFLSAKLGVNFTKDKKEDFITDRTELISYFLRAVYSHQDLKLTEQASIFICRNDNDFNTEKKKMESYMLEYKELETASATFLSIVEKGSQLISNYLGGSKKLAREITKQDIEFETYQSKIIEDENGLKKLSENMQDLALLKAKEAEASKLEGDWDKIETLNNRVEESRKHNIKFSNMINERVLKDLNRLISWIEQIHGELAHRKKLIQFVYSLKQNIDDLSRIRKLERRVEKFQNNFRRSYQIFKVDSAREQSNISKEFRSIWDEYKGAMSKIWK